MAYTYEFDPTGTLPANLITGEQHILTAPNHRDYHFIVPLFAPFFATSLSIVYRDLDNNLRPLVEGIDYHLAYQFIGASRACAKPIYGGISFLNLALTGTVTLVYQTLGGQWPISTNQISEILSDTLRNPRVTTWEQVANVPEVFPPVDHEWDLDDMVGMSAVQTAIANIAEAIANKAPSNPFADLNLFPSKNQIGLGNVDNFKTATDAESVTGSSITRFMTPKGVKLAIQAALEAFSNAAATLTELAKKTGAGLVGTLTGQKLSEAVLCVNTITDLRNLQIPTPAEGKTVYLDVLGDSTIGDAKANRFYWDATSILNDNGVTVIEPSGSTGAGRWISINKDAWIVDNFTAIAGQTTVTVAKAPLYGKVPKIVINNVVELVYKIDFEISGRVIIFFYPLEADDTINIATQIKEINTNHTNDNIYVPFTVTDVNATYTLPIAPTNPQSLHLVLNDFNILYMPGDFNIVGTTMSVTYPLEVGDTLELMSHATPLGYGTFANRALVDY